MGPISLLRVNSLEAPPRDLVWPTKWWCIDQGSGSSKTPSEEMRFACGKRICYKLWPSLPQVALGSSFFLWRNGVVQRCGVML